MSLVIDIDAHFEPGADWLQPYPDLARRLPTLDGGALAVKVICGDLVESIPLDRRPSMAELTPPGLLTLFAQEKAGEKTRRAEFEGKNQMEVANAKARLQWMDSQGIDIQNVICLSGVTYLAFIDDAGLRREVVQAFTGEGKGIACVDHLLTPEALAQLQRFCLRSTVWRRCYPTGYLGANPESGFFSALLLQIAAELRQALPELLGEHHLNYWWSFVCQHQRPGIDIHADQSDISLHFWITPDSANLQPGTGGLDVWDVAAPADWTFYDYNFGGKDIHAFLKQEGARRTTYAYAENRALVFRGSIFHQTAATRFADGFENRRRNVTMLFRRKRS